MVINGVLRGTVTNNKDPDKLGKIQVKINALSDSQDSNWAPISVFMGGNQSGAFFLPDIGDEVLLAFEQGDTTRPYIIGVLWGGKNKPPLTNEDGKNNIRMIKSRSGHILKLDDTEGAEKLEIIDKSSKNAITFDTANNSITIKADININIEASKGALVLKANSIEIIAKEDTIIKGATVNIN